MERTFNKLIIDKSGVGIGQMIHFSSSSFIYNCRRGVRFAILVQHLDTWTQSVKIIQDKIMGISPRTWHWAGVAWNDQSSAKVTCSRRWAARDIQSTCLWSWTTDRRKKHKTSGLTTSSGSTGSSVSMESWSKTKTCTRDSDLVWFSELSIGDQNEYDDSRRLF